MPDQRTIEAHVAGLVEGCPGCQRMAIDIAAARAEADDARRRWWDRLDTIMVWIGRAAIVLALLWLAFVVAPEVAGA